MTQLPNYTMKLNSTDFDASTGEQVRVYDVFVEGYDMFITEIRIPPSLIVEAASTLSVRAAVKERIEMALAELVSGEWDGK